MNKTITALLLSGSLVFAQGPAVRGVGGPPGGPGGPGGFGGARGGMAMLGPGRTVANAPYSAMEVLTVQEKFADGNTVNSTTRRSVARDSAGRTYSSETITPAAASGKAPYTRTTVMDPVAGYRYDLDSSTMIARQSRVPQMRPATPSSATRTPSRTAAAGPVLGTETRSNGATVTTSSKGTATVNGVIATHLEVKEVIPAGAIGNALPITTVRTTWSSPDLKIPVQITSSDPRGRSSDMQLTNISTGEPSAAMFQVPAGYTVQKAAMGRGPGGRGPGGPAGAFRRGGPPPAPAQ